MAGPKTPPTKKPDTGIDWAGMKPHWQAGILSVAELSRRYGCARSAITKHWEKEGVSRNLKAQIQGEAEALVQRAEASGSSSVTPPAAPVDPDHPTDSETVGINARVQATAILNQRGAVRRAKRITDELFTELESQTFDRTLYQRMDELLRKAGKSGRVDAKALAELQALYARTTTFSSRVESNRKLSETLRTLVELERTVLGIADDTPVDPTERVKEAVADGLEQLKARFKARGVKIP